MAGQLLLSACIHQIADYTAVASVTLLCSGCVCCGLSWLNVGFFVHPKPFIIVSHLHPCHIF